MNTNEILHLITNSHTSHLELHAIAVVLDPQFTLLIVNYILDKGLYPELEIPSRQQNILSNVFMGAGVFLKELIYRNSINSALFIASNIDVGDIMIF